MSVLSANQIAGYAVKAGVTGQNVVIATAVALAESSGNSDAQSPPNRDGSHDLGLWQINDKAHAELLGSHNWRDPADNAAMMFTISNGGTNWRPWSTFNNGKYRAFMAQAASATPDTSVTGGVITAGNNDPGPFSALQNFAQIISDPRTWVRFGMVIGGGYLILTAVHMSKPLPIPSVAKFAAKAAAL